MITSARRSQSAANGRSRRILQVVLSLAPGGTERLVIEICRRLAPGFAPTVCCIDDDGAWASELRDTGLEVIALNRRPGFQPALGRRIAQIAQERQIEILHCHQYSPFVYGRIAQLFNPQLGLVYTEHGRLSDAPPSWKRQMVNPVLARFEGAIVAVSDDLRQYMLASRFPRTRVGVVRNGIEVPACPSDSERRRARARLGIADDEFVIASVARLDPVKDFMTLFDAYALVRAAVPKSRLVIIGDGSERGALEARAARPDLAGGVTFLGHRDDVRSLLPGVDLYANSSVSEGVSVTILEAMSAGVPVVATAAGGNPEVLAGGAAGVLVPVRSPERLADAIRRLSEEPARRARLATAGRRQVETSFTIQRMVAEYVQLYQRVLGSH